ncbi:hypothetical protein PPERSA_05648 [Pseudocohnilembus persalinus]|uniref:Uncharacterized protein n=1 Tax=Pseudocohnilembus persalinus TaxID=266149 RepID=A0A0V0QPQ7_PSEPJ|nr:hypothetical protein PPERSA_05648 [Pseudocohnilembus persalinus]|eukprot:KRX04387.1 hypothetical protein PPERSA_05648 [Pseudocohnilembus persalinus]
MTSQEEENYEQPKTYIRLSYEGQQKYKELQQNSIKKFGFWLFVGNLGGFAVAQGVPYLPFKEKKLSKVKRYQRIAFFTSLIAFSYHGYKLSKRDFVRSKKKLLANPAFTLTEPEEYGNLNSEYGQNQEQQENQK